MLSGEFVDRWRQRDQAPARVQRPRQPLGGARLEVAVAHVVFARPDHLHGPADRLRDLGRLGEIVGEQAPAKAPAHQDRVNADAVFWEPGDLHRLFHAAVLGLGRCPELCAVGAHIGGAVHRLERRVCLKRKRVGGFVMPVGGRDHGRRVALVPDTVLRTVEPSIEIGQEAVGIELSRGARDPTRSRARRELSLRPTCSSPPRRRPAECRCESA